VNALLLPAKISRERNNIIFCSHRGCPVLEHNISMVVVSEFFLTVVAIGIAMSIVTQFFDHSNVAGRRNGGKFWYHRLSYHPQNQTQIFSTQIGVLYIHIFSTKGRCRLVQRSHSHSSKVKILSDCRSYSVNQPCSLPAL
jgi:hypothetical protein